MASISRVLQATIVATAAMFGVQAHAVSLNFPDVDAEVSFDGTYKYKAKSLSLNLGPAFNGLAELQAVDGSVPDPSKFIFDLADDADNTGGTFELAYDRSLIVGSSSPGSETGLLQFTVVDVVSFDLDDMDSDIWYIELDTAVADVSGSPVYDDGLSARVTIAGTPLSMDPLISMRISGQGGIVTSAVPEAAPLALLTVGMGGLLLARRRR